MKNTIFQRKLFLKELTAFAKEIALIIKKASPEEIKEHKTLLKTYADTVKVAKKGILTIKEELPPSGVLDVLFELVIEKSKVVETKPTIENKQSYKEALNDFITAYRGSSDKDKELWKDAFEESVLEHKKNSDKLDAATNIKTRLDNFERTKSAKVYCIIKGEKPDGSQWGRIDFVGMNYVMKHKDKTQNGKDSNELKLVVQYYSYEDKTYTFLKSSNQLESIFDKQLMDIFLKSDCTSYELHKQFDRDYEYDPKMAGVVDKGKWYLNYTVPNTSERIAKIVEVPDWDDFGFEDLFNEYLDDCGKRILTNTAGTTLKEKMNQALEKQQGLIHELEAFHVEQNDRDKDSELLIEVWKKRKETFQESMRSLKNNCIPSYAAPEPCTDFQPIFDEHVAKCAANALPKRIGDALKAQMQDCIDNSKTALQEMETALTTFKKIPNWEVDKDVKQKVANLEIEIEGRTEEIVQQEKDLASLPEECIKPIPLEITFYGGNNTIEGQDNNQLREIAQLLINYPTTKIRLTGNTSIPVGTGLNQAVPGITETVQTNHIMPNDVLPSGLSQQEIDSIRSRPTTPQDLMMIRAERVKQLLVNLGVNNSQIETATGTNLGLPKSNQKVILEFY